MDDLSSSGKNYRLPKKRICANFISVFRSRTSTTDGLQIASIDGMACGAKASADPGAKKDFLRQGVAATH
jgi:hypothetical protein